MPWKEVTVMSKKEEFIKLALEGSERIGKLCEAFEISRETGYKLLRSYKKEGWSCLERHSRKPHSSPRKTSDRITKEILEIRTKYPDWGGKKIYYYLKKYRHNEMPSSKTVQRILKKHGCINPEESIKHKPFIRFEHENPNDLWQMDFKGHFETNADRCHPLTLLDDHSRFSLGLRSCANQQKETVKTELINIFKTYGLPIRMTMDNGSPWGYADDQRYTEFSLWLMRLGIQVSHSRPYHPQTQGKLERFHRTLKLELLSNYSFDNLSHAQGGFDWWRKIYNEERPHEAIGFNVPTDRYKPSQTPYPEKLPAIEYDESFKVRKIDCNGILSYLGKEYRVGKGLSGYPVGIKQNEEKEQCVDIYFMKNRVLIADLTMSIK